jgi:predicted transcriptional regulator
VGAVVMLDQLREAGWTVSEFARRVGRPRSTVMRWIDGTAKAPPDVTEWLAAVVERQLANPYRRAEAVECECQAPERS